MFLDYGGCPIPSEKYTAFRSPVPGDLQGVQGGGQILIVEDFQEIERLEQLHFRVDHGGPIGHFANKNHGILPTEPWGFGWCTGYW